MISQKGSYWEAAVGSDTDADNMQMLREKKN